MIRHFTYRDIPSAVRARSVAEAQKRLQATLGDPVTSPEQRAAATRQHRVLRDWARGNLPIQVSTEAQHEAQHEAASVAPLSPAPEAQREPPPVAEEVPLDHAVTVSEALTAAED